VPLPATQNAVDRQHERAPRRASEVECVPMADLQLRSPVPGATHPMTPIVLNATERRFTFRGLPQAVGAARRSLLDWEGHFEPDLFYDLSLCVSELVTNRVQHVQPARGDQAELAVWRSKLLVRAEVREHRPDVMVVTGPGAEVRADWAMFIVDRVADRWGVDRRAGTLVWCEIDLASDGRSRAAPRARGRLSTAPA